MGDVPSPPRRKAAFASPCLVTCAADNTVRLWSLDSTAPAAASSSASGVAPQSVPLLSPNFFSKDMVFAMSTDAPVEGVEGLKGKGGGGDSMGGAVIVDHLPDLEAPCKVEPCFCILRPLGNDGW